MNRDQASLLDALIFSKRILTFTAGMDKSVFADDLKTQAAVLYEISVLGEALGRISKEFRQAHSEIPYRKVIAMRNKLVHEYDGVNLDLVWDVVQNDISELIELISPLVPEKPET
ncbi:DUF86 domain-containing protein [[Limnothrix rosea] IAM M-220]|uniref:HepT-like ribonuclease domain-containing protein n=1 Tax=[Limnothrix rosea] IAM M-220 TaxID=454133 RepID=UPI0009611A83|nr:DUF86 domain-containing protein [[Limnothrix rosea] IAM M-220]OKH17222.1 hypothetical protein NIES208_10465 [[Limnothrix rosea] IAM M-220]